MKKKEPAHFVVCLKNQGYPASLGFACLMRAEKITPSMLTGFIPSASQQ